MLTRVVKQEIRSLRNIWIQFEGLKLLSKGFLSGIFHEENEHADLLAKSAAQGLPLPSEVFFETIKAPSVELLERVVLNISHVHSEDWRTKIISFLQGNRLSDNEAYNKRIEARARPYVIIEGELYKHGVSIAQMPIQSRRYRIDEGNTRRHVWISHRI
jgi:hypothetical protein